MRFTTIIALIAAVFVSIANPVWAQDTSVQNTPVVSVPSGSSESWEGKMAAGVFGMGYFEVNSDFESLYFDFGTGTTRTSGFGFGGFFEFGFSEKFSGEVSMAYSRLTYSSRQRVLIQENFFTADLNAHYHILNNKRFDTYVILGAGAYIGNSFAPTLNLGIGNYFKVSDTFAIKAELYYKTAVILHRIEGRVGVAYSF